jgi:hypothetical protein
MIDQANAGFDQRLGLCPRPVVAANISLRHGEPLSHGVAHAAKTDPAQPIFLQRYTHRINSLL